MYECFRKNSSTKSLGDQVCAGAKDVRACIVRPAIVESSIRYPFPGWNEGFTTSAPLAFLSIKGHRTYPAGERATLDIVPVDMVATGLIMATAATVAGQNELPASWTSKPNVDVLGPIAQNALFHLMDHSDLLVFPTLSDSFGLVITEALARGLPVLTTPNAGAAELVKPDVNGWIVPAGEVQPLVDRLAWCESHLTLVRGPCDS